MTPSTPQTPGSESGFTLIETLVAIGVLATGLLALSQLFTLGLASMAVAPYDILAREKAIEAIESVYTGRDTRTITWAQLRNDGDGGIFADGPQPVAAAGDDGLINTADDGEVESIMLPGEDNELGTDDDIAQRLNQFTREIVIEDVGPNLRRIRVTVRYDVAGGEREYTVETLISSFA